MALKRCKGECQRMLEETVHFHRNGYNKNGTIRYRTHCKDCCNGSKRVHVHDRYYHILSGGGYFRGKLQATGFIETVRAGYFPDGMVVQRGKTRWRIDGTKMVKVPCAQ